MACQGQCLRTYQCHPFPTLLGHLSSGFLLIPRMFHGLPWPFQRFLGFPVLSSFTAACTACAFLLITSPLPLFPRLFLSIPISDLLSSHHFLPPHLSLFLLSSSLGLCVLKVLEFGQKLARANSMRDSITTVGTGQVSEGVNSARQNGSPDDTICIQHQVPACYGFGKGEHLSFIYSCCMKHSG